MLSDKFIKQYFIEKNCPEGQLNIIVLKQAVPT